MHTLTADLLVIGWGKGGKTLAAAAAKAGQRVVIVERDAGMIGGSCINVACIPTKILVHEAASGTPLTAAIERRDTLVAKLNAANKAMLADLDQVTVVMGEAAFVGERRVAVTGGEDRLEITADRVVVNTGTRPRPLDVPGGDLPHVHDSTTIQHVDLPERLVIVGAGPIGLEFADMFARFGSQVTVLSREPLLAREDEDVVASVRQALTDAGVTVVEGVDVEEVTADGVRTSGGTFAADAVLAAIGRVPVVPEGTDAAGIELDERGFVVVDDQLRTTASDVWAVGDVNAGPQFTYISYDDHRIVADQWWGEGGRRRSDRVAVPTTTFMTPPLSRVGMTEKQARDEGRDIVVHAKKVADIAVMPRPKAVGQTHGLIKFVVDAGTDEVLGCAWHGVDAQEVINLVALAMRTKTTASDLRDGIWIHLSSTEALNGVLA
ncbi:MAG: FAD-dependent oxidoreductase [Propionibacteriaceae bacterium]|nr:FAD-dependent oxidoreductase [Propionibacteriaceae bacterium]